MGVLWMMACRCFVPVGDCVSSIGGFVLMIQVFVIAWLFDVLACSLQQWQ